jgi:hypothetical protein
MAWHEQVRDTASKQAAGRGSSGAAGKKRQDLADTVAANLAAGPAISLAFVQPLSSSPTRKTGLEVKKEAKNPIYGMSAFCGVSGT